MDVIFERCTRMCKRTALFVIFLTWNPIVDNGRPKCVCNPNTLL
jgi:hypothetical protein